MESLASCNNLHDCNLAMQDAKSAFINCRQAEDLYLRSQVYYDITHDDKHNMFEVNDKLAIHDCMLNDNSLVNASRRLLLQNKSKIKSKACAQLSRELISNGFPLSFNSPLSYLFAEKCNNNGVFFTNPSMPRYTWFRDNSQPAELPYAFLYLDITNREPCEITACNSVRCATFHLEGHNPGLVEAAEQMLEQ